MGTAQVVSHFVTLPNGLELACEIVGSLSDPVVMPILGITDNLTDWSDSLTRPYVVAGYCIVRHELRDMGLSTQMDGRQYRMEDIAHDVIALMDHFAIRTASLIGYSFGGAIAQLVALIAPDRVTRLVILQGTNYNPSLPARSAAVVETMQQTCIDLLDDAAAVAAIKAMRLACNGPLHAMSEADAQSAAKRSVARGYRPRGTARMIQARQLSEPFFERTPAISCPTLVLQASDDPIFPPGHGEDIVRRISNSTLLYLRGAGHNHPPSLIPHIIQATLTFFDHDSLSMSEMWKDQRFPL